MVKVVSPGETQISFRREGRKDSLKRVDNIWLVLTGLFQLKPGNYPSSPEIPTGDLYARNNSQMRKTAIIMLAGLRPKCLLWLECLSPQIWYVEILMPIEMVLGAGAFGRWLGHEGGALMNGISVHIKEIPQSSFPSPTTWGHSKKVPARNQEEGFHRNMTMLAPWS